jgi:GNAT superfamily N-acetyltransferase
LNPDKIIYRVIPPVRNEELNELFDAAWPEHSWRNFGQVLDRSLGYVCVYHEHRLVGFVNLAWDGGAHAFLIDTTVHPGLRRRGIGKRLVREAAAVARERGVAWLHVDFEPSLRSFYRRCGFRRTEAGLMQLRYG